MIDPFRSGAVTKANNASSSWLQACASAFAAAKNPLIVCDYDGTLAKIASTPEAAAPTPEIIARLKSAAAVANVAVVSGRDAKTLEQWLGSLPIHLVAEHGASHRPPQRSVFTDRVTPSAVAWMAAARAILEQANIPGSMLEAKRTSLSWHYRNASPVDGPRVAAELTEKLAKALPTNAIIHPGKMVLEVRPRGIDKGGALAELVKQLKSDFVLAAGDDRTDEDMFSAAKANTWSIKVGDGETRAKYRVASPDDVLALLASLVTARLAAR